MSCPRCNAAVPFGRSRCSNCGQDLKDYWKIISLSNIYYNKALGQARIRDLTGAIASLKQSLQFNKLNTNARNLLGLIYFETGEIVSALSEWVISKHYQEENNDADIYIGEIQSNPNRLEMHSQIIRKYNSALDAAKHGDEDMAIIQLKKVTSQNPKFIRAKIDVTNTTTLAYLQELSDIRQKADHFSAKPEEPKTNSRKTLPRLDENDQYKTITPYKEEKPSVLPFVNVIIGIITGLAVMYFLIMPHLKSSEAENVNNNFKKYSENQAAADSSCTALKSQNETLQAKVESLKKEMEELQGGGNVPGDSLVEVYEKLFKAANAFLNGDMEKAARNLKESDNTGLQDDAAKKTYNKIAETAFVQASEKLYIQGRDAYNGENEYAGAKDYVKAKKFLEEALSYNPDNTDAMYFLGRTYQQTSKPKKAKEYYEKIINDYPDSLRVADANRRLRELGG